LEKYDEMGRFKYEMNCEIFKKCTAHPSNSIRSLVSYCTREEQRTTAV